jgi:hypothetical protein
MEKVEVKQEDAKVKVGSRPDPEIPDTVLFACARCGLTEDCHYFGLKPQFCRDQVKFSEDTFVLKDPFTQETFDSRWEELIGHLQL